MDRAIKIRLGQTVREFRKQRGLTQAQLGRAAGVTVSQISNIETGHTPPSLGTLVRIARTLRVPLRDLFRFDRTNGDARQALARAKLLAMMNGMTPGELDFALDLLRVVRKRRRAGGSVARRSVRAP